VPSYITGLHTYSRPSSRHIFTSTHLTPTQTHASVKHDTAQPAERGFPPTDCRRLVRTQAKAEATMDDSETTKPTTTTASADEPPNAPRPRAGPTISMSSVSSPFGTLPPLAARVGHELPFVQPSSYLRPSSRSHTIPSVPSPMSPIDEEQMQGLVSPIHNALQVHDYFSL
jgi:hypothetical protein